MSWEEHSRYYVHLAAQGWEGTFDQLRAKAQWALAGNEPGVREMLSQSIVGHQSRGAHPSTVKRTKKPASRWWGILAGAVAVTLVLGHGNPVAGFHKLTSGAATTAKWVIGILALLVALMIMGAIVNFFDFDSKDAGRRLSSREKNDIRMRRKIMKDEMRRRRLY